MTGVLERPVEVPPWRLSDADLQGALVAVAREVSALEGRRSRLLAELEHRGTALAAGATSTGTLAAGLTRSAAGTAHRWVELAVWLDGAPEVAAALDAGEISLEHVRVLASTAAALPRDLPDDGRAECSAFLLEVARGDDPTVLRRRSAELLHLLAPDEVADSEERATRRRELHLGSTPVGGLVPLRGWLDTESAELLTAALSPLAAPRPAADGERDRRSPGRRRADALVELVTLAADHACLPGEGGARPHLTVTVDAAALVSGRGPAAQLGHLGPLSVAAARRLACDAEITPITLDAHLVPLDVGRTARVVTGGLRRALVTRDGGCAFPGCGRPPGWCHAHHVVHWAEGGATSLANTVLLCGHHHRTVHHAGWAVHLGEDGHPWFVPPPWVDPERRARPAHTRRPSPPVPSPAPDDPG